VSDDVECLAPPPKEQSVRLFLCGDVMTGRGIDQILPHPCTPELHERYVKSAKDYVQLAEKANGPIPRRVSPSYIWGAALDEFRRSCPHVRIINLETSITHSEDFARSVCKKASIRTGSKGLATKSTKVIGKTPLDRSRCRTSLPLPPHSMS